VDIELVPRADASTRAAVAAAVSAAGVLPSARGVDRGSPWRAAALVEGVERGLLGGDGDLPGYALSPRSTRGATRA
jgi:hypothetical protein